jgi:hypothetical protein
LLRIPLTRLNGSGSWRQESCGWLGGRYRKAGLGIKPEKLAGEFGFNRLVFGAVKRSLLFEMTEQLRLR